MGIQPNIESFSTPLSLNTTEIINMNTLLKTLAAVVLIVFFVLILGLVLSIPVWLLWNWIIPIVFPGEGIAHHITLLQALGITLLTSLLFRSSFSSSSKD